MEKALKARIILLLLVLASFSGIPEGCQSNHQGSAPDPLDLSARDTSVSPVQDFYEYANGTWIKNTSIPPSYPAWGSFIELYDNSFKDMRLILDSVSNLQNLTKGSIEQQTADLYQSGMDSTHIEQLGIAPLQPYLTRINNIKNSQDVLDEITKENAMGLSPAFSFYVQPDDKNSAVNAAHFDQGGLGLPNKTYYFQQDSSTSNIRKAYVQYIATTLKMIGDSANADKDATGVMQLETAMAKVSKSPVELRDPIANYHKMAVAELNKMDPGLAWQHILNNLMVQQDSILVGQPEFYAGLSKLLQTTSVNVWKNYLRFHLVNAFANDLPHQFVDNSFHLTQLFTGQKEMLARWKRMCSMVDNNLGDALGQLYVKRFFPPESKTRMLKLVNNLIETYGERIQQLDWMSDSTKQKALTKLHAIRKKIGYPDKWKNYSSVSISRDSLINNIINCNYYEYLRSIHKIGKPVDESEWLMTPPTINAYYDPTTNDINFPAGILQPPFFFKDGDDAVNYGAIGAVMGHEMTHGFDDQGRHYDAKGNLVDWWTPEDAAKFQQKANLVIDQYNHFTVLDTAHVEGARTLGENIADIGGIAIAYAAFKKTKEGQSDTLIDGLTPDQRFFLSFAQIWRSKETPQYTKLLIMVDVHSPDKYRVNGPLSNMPAFYKAFNVQPGDSMYRPDSIRIHIW